MLCRNSQSRWRNKLKNSTGIQVFKIFNVLLSKALGQPACIVAISSSICCLISCFIISLQLAARCCSSRWSHISRYMCSTLDLIWMDIHAMDGKRKAVTMHVFFQGAFNTLDVHSFFKRGRKFLIILANTSIKEIGFSEWILFVAIDDFARDGGKEFSPRCTALYHRIPIESLRIRK